MLHQAIAVQAINQTLNSLRTDDAIWRHGTRSPLAQVMACCLTAPSHYLNQCWLISKWHSSEGNFTTGISALNHCNWLEKYSSKISLNSPRPQWVKSVQTTHLSTLTEDLWGVCCEQFREVYPIWTWPACTSIDIGKFLIWVKHSLPYMVAQTRHK